MSTHKKRFFTRNRLLLLIDMLIFMGSYVTAALLSNFSSSSLHVTLEIGWINGTICLVSVTLFRMVFSVYTSIWRHSTFTGYIRIILADTCGGCLALALSYVLQEFGVPAYIGVWMTVSVIAVSLLISVFARLSYQYLCVRKRQRNQQNYTYVAIVGAGSCGAALAYDLVKSKDSKYRPWCFIDIDPQKIGGIINDIRVLDAGDQILEKLKASPVKEVLIALSNPARTDMNTLFHVYADAGFKVRIYDFPSGLTENDGQATRQLRDIRIDDLLFRQPITLECRNDYYTGKRVLITGGGGSIGSELCRQVAALQPAELVIFDIYENNAYDVQQELQILYGSSLHLHVEIGSVRDRARLESVFVKYRPEVVFHAAAHKHVPLMEDNPCETVKNNVLGTYNTADMAEKYGVMKFVLISTDKAVNPTNVMGASKRLCEMVVQARYNSATSFCAVRFGNVLGSNGSVIPLFRKQIENGGPVTVTDKRIIRYFMTIPEASRLVMAAGAEAASGELFVLDMGEPVKILDLAENLIRLSGYRPYVDIDIKEIGLRPGEKLYEELLIHTEKCGKTSNPLIFVEQDQPLTRAEVDAKVQALVKVVNETPEDNEAIRRVYRSVVPSFKPLETTE